MFRLKKKHWSYHCGLPSMHSLFFTQRTTLLVCICRSSSSFRVQPKAVWSIYWNLGCTLLVQSSWLICTHTERRIVGATRTSLPIFMANIRKRFGLDALLNLKATLFVWFLRHACCWLRGKLACALASQCILLVKKETRESPTFVEPFLGPCASLRTQEDAISCIVLWTTLKTSENYFFIISFTGGCLSNVKHSASCAFKHIVRLYSECSQEGTMENLPEMSAPEGLTTHMQRSSVSYHLSWPPWD